MAKPGRIVAALALIMLLSGTITEVRADPGWEQSSLAEEAFAVAVDPSNESVIYATGPSGLWKTIDGAANWSLVSQEKIASTLAIDPKKPSILYAGRSSSGGGGGIYKSLDGGGNWSIVRSGESPSTIAVDPANSSIVYAGLTMNNNYEILKSTDGGANWNRLLQPKFSQSPGIGWVGALAIAPSRPNTIYAGLGGYHSGDVTRSDDGGITWRSAGASGRLAPLMAPSAIAVDPQSPEEVYVGWALMGYKKFFKSPDGGGTWQDLSAGLPKGGSGVYSLVLDPRVSNTLIAAMPGNAGGSPDGEAGGILISHDGGSSWSDLGDAGTDRARIALAPQSRIVYAAGKSGVSSYRLRYRLDPRFQSYYDSHDGLRVLGNAIGRPLALDGYPSQYFEKGRIEDHSGEVDDANWQFMYGLLVDELQAAKASLPVGGDASSLTYASIFDYSRPTARVEAPAGFEGGVLLNEDGSAFVPYHHDLKAEAGHSVPKLFWDYINRTDLFPGGWLHDVGLPMTEAVPAVVDKGEVKGRDILIQAFQRTVLTYDPANPLDWQVERANVGTDYQRAFPAPRSP